MAEVFPDEIRLIEEGAIDEQVDAAVAARRDVAGGVAPLDGNRKVPDENSQVASVAGRKGAVVLAVEDVANAADVRTRGQANGLGSLDANGKQPWSEVNAALLGGARRRGTWDASTNTPNLSAMALTADDMGVYWEVSVAGSTSLGGKADWNPGDFAVWEGAGWGFVENTDRLTSVNGQTGAVVLGAGDVGAAPTVHDHAGQEVRPRFFEMPTDQGAAAAAANVLRFYGALRGSQPTWEAVTPAGTTLDMMRDRSLVVRNNSGGVISGGMAVYAQGSLSGGVPNVARANAGAFATMPVLGIAAADIANNTNGRVVTHGLLSGVDLRFFGRGSKVYVQDSSGPGLLTNLRLGTVFQPVGRVIVEGSTATDGVLQVEIGAVEEAAAGVQSGTRAQAGIWEAADGAELQETSRTDRLVDVAGLHVVLSDPFAAHILGMTPVYDHTLASDRISFTAGNVYIPAAGRVVSFGAIRPPQAGLAANTFYYFYAFRNADGTQGIEMLPDTTMADPYMGDAFVRSNGGVADLTRRYLFSMRTDGSGRFYSFRYHGRSRVRYVETSDVAPFRLLSGGTATAFTAVSAAGVVPFTSRLLLARVTSGGAGTTTTISVPGQNDAAGAANPGLIRVSTSDSYAPEIPLNASRQFSYAVTTNASAFVDTHGYEDRR